MMREQCPRCKGDVRLDRDEYGWYEQCLMCGYMRDMQVLAEPKRISDSGEKRTEEIEAG